MNASSVWIQSFLQEKSAWIESQLHEQQEKLQERLVIGEGRIVFFLGRPRIIRVILAGKGKAQISDEFLYLYTRQNTPAQLEKVFHRWLMEQAREYMATQTIKTARQLGVDHKLKEVVFRRTKTKWGHCCADGTIQYNWLTMMAPKPVIDYLIAHECSHLVHMNHSSRFWNTVARVCPDYQDLRHWLQQNGHRFWTAG